MTNYNEYIVTKRFKQRAICGDLNLKFGLKCFVDNGMICCEKGVICSVTSQNAYDYFTQNDDGCGVIRRKLIENIFDALNRTKQDLSSYNQKWSKVWNDQTCLKYKREDHEGHWLWNYNFYNACIDDLQYISSLIKTKGA